LINYDEQPARLRLKRLLSNFQEKITLVAEADCGRHVIFLDIQMPDMTGFEVLAALTYQPLIIFTTAYEQYAIKAFENYSIDYLVKPFGAARFEKAIQKLEKFGQVNQAVDYSKLEQLVKELKSLLLYAYLYSIFLNRLKFAGCSLSRPSSYS